MAIICISKNLLKYLSFSLVILHTIESRMIPYYLGDSLIYIDSYDRQYDGSSESFENFDTRSQFGNFDYDDSDEDDGYAFIPPPQYFYPQSYASLSVLSDKFDLLNTKNDYSISGIQSNSNNRNKIDYWIPANEPVVKDSPLKATKSDLNTVRDTILDTFPTPDEDLLNNEDELKVNPAEVNPELIKDNELTSPTSFDEISTNTEDQSSVKPTEASSEIIKDSTVQTEVNTEKTTLNSNPDNEEQLTENPNEIIMEPSSDNEEKSTANSDEATTKPATSNEDQTVASNFEEATTEIVPNKDDQKEIIFDESFTESSLNSEDQSKKNIAMSPELPLETQVEAEISLLNSDQEVHKEKNHLDPISDQPLEDAPFDLQNLIEEAAKRLKFIPLPLNFIEAINKNNNDVSETIQKEN